MTIPTPDWRSTMLRNNRRFCETFISWDTLERMCSPKPLRTWVILGLPSPPMQLSLLDCLQCNWHNYAISGYHPQKSTVAEIPMDHLVMDVFGPLPVTDLGNRFGVLLRDVASRLYLLRAAPDQSAKTMARILLTVFCDFGFLKILQ